MFMRANKAKMIFIQNIQQVADECGLTSPVCLHVFPRNGNILLGDRIQKHGEEHLVYSILHTMDIGARKEDVIRMETSYKEAFGTRIHGLNKN
jgi:hypothetical protein